jgi:hypothetical protein
MALGQMGGGHWLQYLWGTGVNFTLDRYTDVILKSPDNLIRNESRAVTGSGPVTREDGENPSLPRNCERNEICRCH